MEEWEWKLFRALKILFEISDDLSWNAHRLFQLALYSSKYNVRREIPAVIEAIEENIRELKERIIPILGEVYHILKVKENEAKQ